MSGYNFEPNRGPLSSDSSGNQTFWFPVIYLSLKPSALTANASAQKLTPTPLAGRKIICITNNSSVDTIYIGDNTVSTLNGTPIAPQAKLIVAIADNIDLWVVSSGTSTDVRCLEGI